jgi:acetyl-CoA synthetase
MLPQAETYREVCDAFAWQVPEYYNIGIDICDKHAAVKNRTVLIYETEDGEVKTYTFDDIIKLSNPSVNVFCLAWYDGVATFPYVAKILQMVKFDQI